MRFMYTSFNKITTENEFRSARWLLVLLRAGPKSPAINHIFNVLGFGLIFLIRRANNWLKGCPELAYTPLVLQHASHRIDKRARVPFSVVS